MSVECYKGVYYTLAVWRFKPFSCRFATTFVFIQASYCPENGVLSVLRKKTKAVCGLGSTNYGGLGNVPFPIIDLLISLVRYETICHGQF